MAKGTRAAIVLVAFILLLTVPCSGGCRPGPFLSVRIAAYPSELSAAIAVSQEEGFFSSNGLDVTTNNYETGVSAIEALMAGKADVATASDYAFASSVFTMPELRLLASIDRSSAMWFVTREDIGIAGTDELRGRSVGVTPGTSAEYALGSSLGREGLALSDVRVVYLAPGELGEALASGTVDAVVAWDPVAYDIREAMGRGARFWFAQGSRHYHWTLVSKESVLEANPEMSERLMRSMVDAEQFISERPEEAKRIVSELYDLDEGYVDYAWRLNRFKVELSQHLMFELDSQAHWFMESGKAGGAAEPNYLEFIDFSGLERADPDAVSIVH